MTLVAVMLTMFLINGPSALIAERYADFDVANYKKGLFLLCTSVPFTFTSLLLHFLTEKINKRAVFCIGFGLLTIGNLLLGPSKVLGLPDKLEIILTGQAFFGMSFACLMVPAIPLLTKFALQFQQVHDEKPMVINYLSGFFNAAFGLGSFLGPMIFTLTEQGIGFRQNEDVFSLVTLISGVLFGLGIYLLKPSKNLQAKMGGKMGETALLQSSTPIDSVEV
jgi:MFS family permease